LLPKEAAHLLALPKDVAISYRASRRRAKRQRALYSSKRGWPALKL
jgi:hypothetical protein